MQQIKYASTAWNDIKNTPGWLSKVAILALLQFIPIFGQIVLFGYIYTWARDIAWGVHSPMPAKIFGNEDGKLYSRGFFILVIMFVFNLVPYVLTLFTSGVLGGASALNNGSSNMAIAGMASFFGLVSIALSVAVLLFFGIAAMRTAIYDRISAGFQLKKLWAMFRYDTNGALRILGMSLLISFILTMVFSILFVILSLIAFGASAPAIMSLSSGSDVEDVLVAIGPSFGVWMLFMMVVSFIALMASVFTALMVARASGYWTQQFNVAQWRGQDDPMPFEMEQQAQQAQAAQYAAQVQYAQAQAEYAQVQGQQINYADQQAQQQYAQAQAAQAQPQPQQVQPQQAPHVQAQALHPQQVQAPAQPQQPAPAHDPVQQPPAQPAQSAPVHDPVQQPPVQPAQRLAHDPIQQAPAQPQQVQAATAQPQQATPAAVAAPAAAVVQPQQVVPAKEAAPAAEPVQPLEAAPAAESVQPLVDVADAATTDVVATADALDAAAADVAASADSLDAAAVDAAGLDADSANPSQPQE